MEWPLKDWLLIKNPLGWPRKREEVGQWHTKKRWPLVCALCGSLYCPLTHYDTIQCDLTTEKYEYPRKPTTLDNIQLIKIHTVTGIFYCSSMKLRILCWSKINKHKCIRKQMSLICLCTHKLIAKANIETKPIFSFWLRSSKYKNCM